MTADLQTRLDAATSDHRILEHPFYRAWAQGTLTRDDLAHYSAQYFRQVDAFPGWLEALRDRLPDGIARAVVTENLRDERDDDHPGLWLRFAEALGLDAGDVRATPAAPETDECTGAFESAATSGSLPFALGMLYGYESQTPGVAATKVEGLERYYGVTGAPAEYFTLHGELDVEHSAEMLRAIDSIATDEGARAEAAAGAAAGAAAVWKLLDGVVRERSITC